MGEAVASNLNDRLAHELDGARQTLEQLALQLCLDPVVFARHAEPLQQFDQLAQVMGEVAKLLRDRSSAPEAIATVRLETMRERLASACCY